MRGRVSVYINYKKYDDSDQIDEIGDNDDQAEDYPELESENNKVDFKRKRIREKLGNHVASLGII